MLRYYNILCQLRIKRCDNETVQDITDLKGELSDSEYVIHLYLTNLLVDMHNNSHLNLLEGEHILFTATSTGDILGLVCPAPEVPHFKTGAPVVVLHNINENIHNGPCRIFVKILSEDNYLG